MGLSAAENAEVVQSALGAVLVLSRCALGRLRDALISDELSDRDFVRTMLGLTAGGATSYCGC